MKNQFRVINRTTREEQVFNSEQLQRFFHCEYDPQTQKVKYNQDISDYAISQVKSDTESWVETIVFACFGMVIVIVATKIIMQWI